ncbi:MAG: hypothetical protein GXO47_03560 [Chlorobi bacterium]|nr:hypothetical protein [Chlorobiota bacterium]
MKKLTLLVLALFMAMGSLFSQIKYKPDVVVLFLGEKNPTFDESKYPDLKFYYLPEIKMVPSRETKEKKTIAGKIIKATFGSTPDNIPTGQPEEIIKLGVNEKDAFLFDKNGTFTGSAWGGFDIAERGINEQAFLTCGKRKTVTTDGKYYEYSKFEDLAKNYIKKGKTNNKKINNGKPKKNSNPDHYKYLYGKKWPDFKVKDASGKEYSFNEIVSGKPLTLVYVVHLNKDTDLNAAYESGKDKTGKEYVNDVWSSLAGGSQIYTLALIESQVFGHKVEH